MNHHDRIGTSTEPRGKDDPPPEFPLPSLRKFMLPGQLVLFQSFEASSLSELDREINQWVARTKSIIAIPSSISLQQGEDGQKYYRVGLTYVEATGRGA